MQVPLAHVPKSQLMQRMPFVTIIVLSAASNSSSSGSVVSQHEASITLTVWPS